MKEEQVDEYSDESLFNISSWGADMSFRELVEMYKEGELIRPEFQRNYVWKKLEASRFIESILLGLPVPSIFLANSAKNEKLIIDGYQRIMTVYDYVERKKFGNENILFRLTNSEKINRRWRNKSFDELTPEDQRRIKSKTIHAIVFEQKMPKDDDTSMFQIFSRINTSGRSLNAQEIRNCVCQGPFNSLLFELNQMPIWREMYGVTNEEPRMLDIELILRFFAIRDLPRLEDGRKQINLRKYLDLYMKSVKEDSLMRKREDFARMISFVYERFGIGAFSTAEEYDNEARVKINPIVFEAISVASDSYLRQGHCVDCSQRDFPAARVTLLRNEDFKNASSSRTTDIENIERRIRLARQVLFDV